MSVPSAKDVILKSSAGSSNFSGPVVCLAAVPPFDVVAGMIKEGFCCWNGRRRTFWKIERSRSLYRKPGIGYVKARLMKRPLRVGHGGSSTADAGPVKGLTDAEAFRGGREFG